jgi:hypothetical protein
MVDPPVLEKWWAQLDYSERMRILYFSDMAEMKVGAGIGAQRTSYSTFRRDIQEVIEKAFLEGREGEGFWFGIKWHFLCPLCEQESWERGMIWFQSGDPQEVRIYLGQQGAVCMECSQAPPDGTNIQIQLLKAPAIVLRELDFVAPDAEHPVNGTYFADAWRNATSSV